MRDDATGSMAGLFSAGESRIDWPELASAAGSIGRFVYDPETGEAEGDATLAAVTGVAGFEGPMRADDFIARVHEADRERIVEALRAAGEAGPEGGGAYEAVFRFRRDDGRVVWLEGEGRMVRLDGRALLVGVNHDVSDLRAAQERAELVAGEMEHRIKNVFALIQSIFVMAARSSDSVEGLRDAFVGRLQALGALNALSLGDRDAPIALRALLDTAAGGPLAAGRLSASLPPRCRLTGPAAQTMVLLINELATNAVKHGALRDEAGRVDLRATIRDGRFTFAWSETTPGGVVPPAREGFGMKVLTSMTASTAGGDPEVDWRPEGLRFSCTWPTAGFVHGA